MLEHIYFEIPEWVNEEDLEDHIAGHHEQFSEALDYTADYHDDRSVVDEVRIESVELNDKTVTINYEVDYSAHHTCSDMSYAKTHLRVLRGFRDGRTSVFEKTQYPTPRTTFEEF